ncbi:hypothetical protein [Paenibacillus odorifer]
MQPTSRRQRQTKVSYNEASRKHEKNQMAYASRVTKASL